MEVCAFAGHSMFVECRLNFEKLIKTLQDLINNGVKEFLIGNHGEFDKMAFRACLILKEHNPQIKITRVFSSLLTLLKEPRNEKFQNICYDIEDIYFKRRITKTNEIMIENSDVVVCYVDEEITHSGAKTAFNFAKKKNKKIINLYWQTRLIVVKCNRTLTRVVRHSNGNLS